MIEGIDFYFNQDGLMVLTAKYLKKRGVCCFSGCLHCPYGFTQKMNPLIPAELQLADDDCPTDDDC